MMSGRGLFLAGFAVDGDAAEGLMELVEALEDNDDVQEVFTNVEISDADAATLSA